ncbi:MAG: AAA family ATPase [Betaproteobacteria bacterium]|nr:AAA family ATPase [Betaproteobacteria bacterium]
MALYLEHFGLSEPAFRITPHTDFFFDGADRGATLEALVYAVVHDEGIVKVSGEVGSGKTMLCRVLMERLPPHVETLYVATPSLAKDEILHAIADELDLNLPDGRTSVALRELQESLIRLYAAGRRVVVLIDEAHVMPDDTLEQVRLLSNLETNRHKLLQIVLFGQPELDATLSKPGLRQLRDRITNSFRMRPLSEPEVAKYISFRMRAAGYRGPDLFNGRALSLITRASGGLTRRINILADKALLAAFSANAHAVTEREVRAAVSDSEFATKRKPAPAWAFTASALAAGLAAGVGIHWWISQGAPPPAPPAVEAQPKPMVEAPATQSSPPSATAATAPAAPPPVPPMAAEVKLAANEPSSEKKADVPAVQEEPSPKMAAALKRRFAAYSPRGQELLAGRLAASRDFLARTPGDRYALELFWTDNVDPGRMERFLRRASDLVPIESVYVVPASNAGSTRLHVLYGEFASREEAMEAAKRLPPRYQQAFRAAPRSVAELRGQI